MARQKLKEMDLNKAKLVVGGSRGRHVIGHAPDSAYGDAGMHEHGMSPRYGHPPMRSGRQSPQMSPRTGSPSPGPYQRPQYGRMSPGPPHGPPGRTEWGVGLPTWLAETELRSKMHCIGKS